MSFLARDIYEAGSPQLKSTSPDLLPRQVVSHIWYRMLDSLGPGLSMLNGWIFLDGMFDHDTWLGGGLFRFSVGEVPKITAEIDNGHLCPIGVVLVHSIWPWSATENHVVLAYGYDRVGSTLRLWVYDCNYPNDDSIHIEIDDSAPSPSKPITTNGTSTSGLIRGFFKLETYTWQDPSSAYVDVGTIVDYQVPADMKPGANAIARIHVRNGGSSTWDMAVGYRVVERGGLNSAYPMWGGQVVDPGTLVPNSSAIYNVPITAPLLNGTFRASWGVSRAGLGVFVSSPPVAVYVTADSSTICANLHKKHRDLSNRLKSIEKDRQDAETTGERMALTNMINSLKLQLSQLESEQRSRGCTPG
ncbi:hypothetical protein [Kribbella antiqua]|nr:hypothetical protein [Kribbella antiqua]